MNASELPNEQRQERIPRVSEAFKKYTEDFLSLAEKELGYTGVEDLDIKAFSESFRAVYAEEIMLCEQGQGSCLENVDDFVDGILSRAIGRLNKKALKDVMGVLWGLRAEEREERLERKQSGKAGDVVEFGKGK